MKDRYIYNWLKQMETESDRDILKSVSAAFQEVIAYNNQGLREITDRMEQELFIREEPCIRCSVIERKDLPLLEGTFYPVAELEDNPYFLGLIFFETDRAGIEHCLSGSFRAVLKKEEQIVGEGFVRFYPCYEFQEQVSLLEQSIYENEICCTGLNTSYLHRFLKMIWEIDQDADLPEKGFDSAFIEGIFDTYSFRWDVIPVWNVRTISQKSSVFPVPAGEDGFYEHRLMLPTGDDTYLVCTGQSFESAFYREGRFIVRSQTEAADEWRLYQILSGREKEIYVPHYPIVSNERTMTNGGRLAERSVRRIATKAEILRVFQSRKAASDFTVLSLEWKKPQERLLAPYNGTVSDSTQECLTLCLECRNKSFILEEQVSYLLGVLQRIYPEFTFMGEVM